MFHVTGPYFTVGQLADIAQELDQKERELMLSMGVDTADVCVRSMFVVLNDLQS